MPRFVQKNTLLALALAATVSLPNIASAQKVWPPLVRPDPARVAEIAALDSARPLHFSPPFSDRAFWDAQRLTDPARSHPAVVAASAEILSKAEAFLDSPTPTLTEELYDEFLKNGNRINFEKPFALRLERLGSFLFAEGLQNDGRFLSAIESEMSAILDEPSWALPAHAHGRKTWQQARTNVELAATARAWSLATADYLLGDRLAPEIRARLRKEVRERIIAPVSASLRAGGDTPFKWLVGENNWNGVCTAGVLGTVLLLSEDPGERATFIVAAENASPFYLSGFSDDGYCHEGLRYWAYGYGHYILTAELTRLATGGRLDPLADSKARHIATFPGRWEIGNGIYAAFGDSGIHQKTPASITNFAAVRYGIGEFRPEAFSFIYNHPSGAHLYRTPFQLALFAEQAATQAKGSVNAGFPLRDWFPKGGALVVRSLRGGPDSRDVRWGAAFKGGHNGQPHNHNDLGSYALVKNGVLMLADLGMERYTGDSFGPKRYSAGLMNSFGHPVPRLAGELQRVGPEARAVTVRSEFTDARDLWEIDLTSAYSASVPDLERLTRTFIFTRATGTEENAEMLEIIDTVKFRSPQSFGNAVILAPRQKYDFIRTEGSSLSFRVHQGGESVLVTINADTDTGSDLHWLEEPVHGVNPKAPARGIRLGFDLNTPVTEATLRTRITP